MKATILSGLIAVALGGLTSCSNILEENGVINNVAESGMGELRINLTTDASLNVSTKGGEGTEPVNINGKSYDINTGDFNVTAVLSSSTANMLYIFISPFIVQYFNLGFIFICLYYIRFFLRRNREIIK